jgi:hypothetical protein
MRCYGESKKGKPSWNAGTKGVMKPNSGSFKPGSKHRLWRGKNRHYYVVPVSKRKNTKYLHRDVMEKHLGRRLRRDEEVHHIDFDKHNNDVLNLIVLTKSEHARLHMLRRHAKRRLKRD